MCDESDEHERKVRIFIPPSQAASTHFFHEKYKSLKLVDLKARISDYICSQIGKISTFVRNVERMRIKKTQIASLSLSFSKVDKSKNEDRREC